MASNNRQLCEFQSVWSLQKLKNKYFDDLVKKTRGKFGGTLIPSKEIKTEVKLNAENHILSYYGFVSDQSPRIRTVNYFTKFLVSPFQLILELNIWQRNLT